jgi:lipopolysaccharide/colanic/teichoic acid biosynthesis glycosyltransferase/O-antigen/teichoic acid export membrane protein
LDDYKIRLLKLRRSALTGNVAALIGALVSLTLATLMVARVGGPSAVGDYALLRVMPWLLAVVVSGGLAAATPWFLAGPTRDDPRMKSTLMAMAVASAVASLLIWTAASPLLRVTFFRDLPTVIVAWAGLKSVSRLLVITAKAGSQGTGDLPGTNHAIVLEELLFIPGYAAALLLGLDGGAAVVTALIGADVVTGAIAWRRLISRRYFDGVGRPSVALAKRVYAFGLRGQVGSLMYLVNLRLDFMIVDLMAGPAILGVYAVASKFAELLRLLPISFEWVLYPGFARQAGKEAWTRAAWLAPRAAAATALAALPLALAAQPVIPLFYGSAFASAVQPTRLLLIGLSVEGASGVITAYLFGRGRPGLNSIATFGGVMVTVGLDLLLIPRFSLIGASIASTAAYLTTTSLLGACFLLLQPRSMEPVVEVGEAIPPGTFRRLVDVIVACAALAALSPAMLVAWLGARVSTGASGIYRQVRVGEGGTAFTMLKFRTMKPGEAGPEVTASGDPRVTRFGHILRATSIDELPQLINVLRGDMTLVSARPETVGLARRYPATLQQIFRYRPGLTGPAQLYLRQTSSPDRVGDVEADYISVQVPARVALDLDYLKDPTARRTLALIVRTMAYVPFGILLLVKPQTHKPSRQFGPRTSHAHESPWRLLTSPAAIQFDVPVSSSARRQRQQQVRDLPAGTSVVLCSTAIGSRWRCRRFARDAGIEVLREYVAIPSPTPPTCYVEETPLALRYFFTQVSALPGGGAAISAVLAAAKKAARFIFPAALIGALAPTRIVVGRLPTEVSASPASGSHRRLDASDLLDVRDMETIVLALSKDPNAKLTVLLLPRGGSRPTLAVKVPTTEAAEGNIFAERRVLSELNARLPASMLATIPTTSDMLNVEGRPILVATALPGSPMAARYHGWRHVATPSAVEADFKMVGEWLAKFQSATAGVSMPIDMDGGITDVLRTRFANDLSLDSALARLSATYARLSKTTTPRTAVHGDFWFGNLLVAGDEISGVIDWESGTSCGEPVRDIVRFAITYALYLDRHSPAGGRVAGHSGLRTGVWGSGIEFALDGRGWFPDLFRNFMRDSLSRLGADPNCWREATLAGLAEVSAVSDHEAFAWLHWQLFARLSDQGLADRRARTLELAPAFGVTQVKPSDVA